MLFRYLAARWKHPDPALKCHIRAGLALEYRSRHLNAFWADHLSRSRAAQGRWAQSASGQLLTVLGAGPLFDLNVPALSPRFRKFRLVDANPLVVSRWTRVSNPVEPVITDVTRCLPVWTKQVSELRQSWPATLDFIRNLNADPVKGYASPSDGLISLNLLSQLDVGWQEALEPVLFARFGKRYVQKREQEWLQAIQPSSQMLIEQHLAALEASGARHLLLISDLDYVEYSGRHFRRDQLEPPPVRWSSDAWQGENGVNYQLLPMWEGLTLDQKTFERWLPAYQMLWHETWLWHISPLGTEDLKQGKIHRVGAFAFVRKPV